jgi:hypothetical protein
MAKPRPNLATANVARPGDGTLLPIIVEPRVGVDGVTGYSVGIDASAAPVPDRRYVPDVFAMIAERNAVKILLGQQRIGSSKTLRSLVIINMTADALIRMVRQINAMSDPSVREIAANLKLSPENPATIDDEPEQTISFAANLAVSAISFTRLRPHS